VSAAAPTQASRTTATELTWAIQTNPASLFNAFCFCSVGQTVMSLVQDHMLAPGTFGQPLTGDGAVVSSWKAVSPTVYRYTVKPGIRFSDGSTLTAADVAFSLNVHRDPEVASRVGSFFGNVKSVTSKGNVVTVQLKTPDSNWQYVPTATPGLVYSQAHYLKNKASYGTPSALPIGTGPYKFKEWQPNAKIVLERNPFYKGKTKYPFNTITIPIIPNEQTLLLAMQSGQIDGTFAVPLAQFGAWQKAPNTKVGSFTAGSWRGFSFDTEDGPFQDVNVRRALAYSLDMEGINKALNSGLGQVVTGMPPLIFLRGILPKAEIDAALKKIPKYTYSVEKAKAELAKSKYPNGFTTTMNVPGPCQPCILLSQTLQQGAKAIGITINFNVMPGPPRFQVILDHKPGLGIQVLGQAPDTPHPMQFQDLLYPSSHAAPGFENSANLKNPTIDKLIQQGLRSTDIKVAARNALKVQAIVATQVPYIHVFTFPVAWAVKSGWGFKSSIGPFYYNQIWLQHLRSN
jgi:peptide/nickel transport system substrate-binding protein